LYYESKEQSATTYEIVFRAATEITIERIEIVRYVKSKLKHDRNKARGYERQARQVLDARAVSRQYLIVMLDIEILAYT